MIEPNDLYRQTKIAQRQAERGGFIGTATALAGIAEMIILEAGVDAEVIAQFSPRTPPPPVSPFPISC